MKRTGFIANLLALLVLGLSSSAMATIETIKGTLTRITVLMGRMAVTAATLLLFLNPQNAIAQVGRDLTVNISQAGAALVIPTRTNVAFVVTASNVRAGSANNVLVSVSLPQAFTSLSATPEPASGFTCTFKGNICSCTTPTLAGNTQKTFRISATAPSTISGTSQPFTLTAQVDPANTVSEGDDGNNSDNLTVNVVTRADLDVNLTGAPGLFTTQVAPNLVYVVTVKNTGDREAPNLLVRSTLPKDVAFVKVEENQLGTCLQNSSDSSGALQVNCTLSSLPAGANRHVRIIGKIIGSIPDGTQVTFAANVDPNKTVPERNDTDNTAFMITTVRAPSDLQISGNAISLATGRGSIFDVGDSFALELHLTVKNNGPFASPPTIVRTGWPSGFTRRTGCFDVCDVPAIAPGQSVQISMAADHHFRSGFVDITSTVDPDQRLFDGVLRNNRVTFRGEVNSFK